MKRATSNWIVFYTKRGTRCDISFTFDGRPSLSDVAGKIASLWSDLDSAPALAAASDSAAQEFLNVHEITDVTFLPFIEKRQSLRS